MINKKWGWVFLFLSFILIFWNFEFSITGNFIREYFEGTRMVIHIIGLTIFVLSILLLTKKEGLEYLVIPTGWEEPRIKKAKEELDKGYADKIVITGHVDKGKIKGSHRQKIYKEMRKYGIKPSQMRVLDGIDSEEDIVYLGKIVKPGDTIYFDTFPLHFQEYKTLVEKAKRDKKFPLGVRIKNVKIHQGPKEIIYGIAGWLEELLRRREMDLKKNRPPEDYLDKLKGKVKKFLS